MSWQSCGGRWWLAASRSVHAGAWGSSCTPSGFATILRHACGSWPNAGCVETSPAGWATLRSTSANAMERSSTTGLPGPAGPGPGGAGAGTDLETGADSPDASRIWFAGGSLRAALNPGPFDGWDHGRTCLVREADATTPARGQSARGLLAPGGSHMKGRAPSGGRVGREVARVKRRSHAPRVRTPGVRDRARQGQSRGGHAINATPRPQRAAIGIPTGTPGWGWLDERC